MCRNFSWTVCATLAAVSCFDQPTHSSGIRCKLPCKGRPGHLISSDIYSACDREKEKRHELDIIVRKNQGRSQLSSDPARRNGGHDLDADPISRPPAAVVLSHREGQKAVGGA